MTYQQGGEGMADTSLLPMVSNCDCPFGTAFLVDDVTRFGDHSLRLGLVKCRQRDMVRLIYLCKMFYQRFVNRVSKEVKSTETAHERKRVHKCTIGLRHDGTHQANADKGAANGNRFATNACVERQRSGGRGRLIHLATTKSSSDAGW